MQNDDVVYNVEHLSFAYEGTDTYALDDVSLCIERGSVVVICGPSGCGKTTLIRHLKPAVWPSGSRTGKVLYCGRDIMSIDDRCQAEDIGYIYQNPESQIATDRVWTELAFGLESLGMSRNTIRQKVADAASYFGIQDMYEKKVSELSGGEQQYLNLASVIVMNPSVIILDEPISQLDPVSASGFIDMIGKLNRELGVTIVITAHRLEELMPISTDIFIMSECRVLSTYNKNDYSRMVRECGNDIWNSLPAAARIYTLLEEDNNSGREPGNCPFSVAEGRRWLKSYTDVPEHAEYENATDKKNTVVNIKNVYYRYPAQRYDTIKNMSLSLCEGEIYGIVGSNGSGKSTLLSLIAGIIRPDHGKITIADRKKIALLPQKPELLFQKNTVRDEVEGAELSDKIISICSLEKILAKNPFSLSGGEKQRVAIAKILKNTPDIILMDEPSKGMDSINKKKLTGIIKELADKGHTIIIVSHDLEFIAESAGRCGMLFDGAVIADDNTHDFMLGNDYYTTAVTRITKGIIDGCVTIDDVGSINNRESSKVNVNEEDNEDVNEDIDEDINADADIKYDSKNSNENNNKKIINFIMWFTYIILMPATVWIGMSVLQDKKYFFISLLILLESVIPFWIGYEKKNHSSRMVVVIAVMCAIAVTSRVAFYMLPTFKPIAAIVIISGAALGGESGFIIGSMSMLISNIFFGQGAWTPWQMFAMGLVGLISGLMFYRYRYNLNRAVISATGALLTLIIYGGIVNMSTLFIMRESITPESLSAIYIAGLPVDLIFAGVTAVCLWFLLRPMTDKLLRISGTL